MDSNSNNICDRDETPTTIKPVEQPTVAQQPTAPAGCQYNNPSCSTDYECLNNNCVRKQGCQYNNPPCLGNYDCVANQCVQKECPYECCDGVDYKLKTCATDYRCDSHSCKAIDSDNDGLYDYEEKRLGTSTSIADSDSDGLSDYTEVRVKLTNPLNPNSDNDRYGDSQDLDPLKKNSAHIRYTVTTNYEMNWLIGPAVAAACYTTGCTAVLLLDKLGDNAAWMDKRNWDFVFINDGDDYTSSYEGDFSIYVAKVNSTTRGVREQSLADLKAHPEEWTKLYTEHFTLDRFEPGSSKTKKFTHTVLVREVPAVVFDAVAKGAAVNLGVIENERYEKYN